ELAVPNSNRRGWGGIAAFIELRSGTGGDVKAAWKGHSLIWQPCEAFTFNNVRDGRGEAKATVLITCDRFQAGPFHLAGDLACCQIQFVVFSRADQGWSRKEHHDGYHRQADTGFEQ